MCVCEGESSKHLSCGAKAGVAMQGVRTNAHKSADCQTRGQDTGVMLVETHVQKILFMVAKHQDAVRYG